jgi:hypothetical protein
MADRLSTWDIYRADPDAHYSVSVDNHMGEVCVNTGEWAYLTPDQADAMAEALRVHAAYVRTIASEREDR